MKYSSKIREIGNFEYFGKIEIPSKIGVKIKAIKPIENREILAVAPTRKNPDSPKNFTEIFKIGSRKYLELALLISFSINFLTFLIFVCIYFK